MANVLLGTVLKRATGAHLLFPEQVPASLAARIPVRRVFHDFVPVSRIPRSDQDERFVLFLGFPWYLKGVDLLIEAFRQIADEVPDVRLRVVGYFPDREGLERHAQGHPRVSIEKAVKAPEALDLIARCSVLVLPSRTEAMGRVLLEAWASGKPVVASRVDGIPHYVTHEQNGLLFESENVGDLAKQLLRVLKDRDLAQRLAETGHRLVRERWTEEHFREAWDGLIAATLDAGAGRRVSGLREALAYLAARPLDPHVEGLLLETARPESGETGRPAVRGPCHLDDRPGGGRGPQHAARVRLSPGRRGGRARGVARTAGPGA